MTRKKSNKTVLLLVAGLIIMVAYSCSTKKNTFTRRVFHNITGHYNMFWNGRESYREGVAQLEKTVKDNYNTILPVFNYGTETEAQALNSYMDKAIEKSSINIQRHSMYFRHKEYVHWIDDSYLLIGKAYFYKQEYNKARRTFEFVINEYKKNQIKYEANLWLGNSYNQLKKFKRAQSVLDNLQAEINKNPKVPYKVQQYLPLVKADMYILQKKYDQAAEQLTKALYMNQRRKMDVRVRFILAQIYQSKDELYKASAFYKQVIRKNPPYEMAFNAAINLAKCYDVKYGEDSKSIVKNLEKMLKEDKNLPYRDQIYYALAEIALKNQQDSLAINYLTLSVATSKNNNFQKATSSLKLGDIYFGLPQYKLAQAYYDTAVQVLPKDYPDYNLIVARTNSLTDLVTNLIVIETEDSLQKIAAMSEEERNAVIDKIIANVIKDEEQQKEMEQQLLTSMANQSASSINNIGGPIGSGGWYFYNPAALSNGRSEFAKKWGPRKLEDNWFLSNKQSTYQPGEEEIVEASDSTSTDSTRIVSNDPHTRDYYLQNLPFTDTLIAVSNAKIEDAYFNLGFIYKDKLDDYPKAEAAFDTLLKRFPDNKNLLEIYYQLYRIYTVEEKPDEAAVYKNLIVENYPESDYAKLLIDPDYYKELEAQKNQALNLYTETYEHYEKGHYYTVYSNSSRALKEFSEPKDILAKFSYLRAVSIGKIEVIDSLVIALDSLIAQFPQSDVVPLAQNLLDYINGPKDTTSTKEKEEVFDVSMYEFNPNSKQIFALVVKDENVNINALKVRISDFDMKYFSLDNISITNILLDANTSFIMVGNFETIKKAMNYYRAIMSNDYVFANIPKNVYKGFVIAQENYPVFYKDKDVKKYLAFFKQNYLDKK